MERERFEAEAVELKAKHDLETALEREKLQSVLQNSFERLVSQHYVREHEEQERTQRESMQRLEGEIAVKLQDQVQAQMAIQLQHELNQRIETQLAVQLQSVKMLLAKGASLYALTYENDCPVDVAEPQDVFDYLDSITLDTLFHWGGILMKRMNPIGGETEE